jgi:hypothetical protein
MRRRPYEVAQICQVITVGNKTGRGGLESTVESKSGKVLVYLFLNPHSKSSRRFGGDLESHTTNCYQTTNTSRLNV